MAVTTQCNYYENHYWFINFNNGVVSPQDVILCDQISALFEVPFKEAKYFEYLFAINY